MHDLACGKVDDGKFMHCIDGRDAFNLLLFTLLCKQCFVEEKLCRVHRGITMNPFLSLLLHDNSTFSFCDACSVNIMVVAGGIYLYM
jgi:hypothetical protein